MPFLVLFVAVLLLGTADAMAHSYIVLFGADVVGLTPLQIGVWTSISALSGIIAGWWLGRRFDRRPARSCAIGVILLVPARVSQRLVILGGFGAFVCFYAVTIVASGLPLLVLGQVLRGIGIAIVGAAGLRWFQDLLAPATGRATTLFSNAATAGLLVSGILSGLAVEQFGYRVTLVLCGILAAAGGVAFAAGSAGRTRVIERNRN